MIEKKYQLYSTLLDSLQEIICISRIVNNQSLVPFTIHISIVNNQWSKRNIPRGSSRRILSHLELKNQESSTLLFWAEITARITFPFRRLSLSLHHQTSLLRGARIGEIAKAFGCGTAVSRAWVKLVAVRRVAATINRVLESKSRILGDESGWIDLRRKGNGARKGGE